MNTEESISSRLLEGVPAKILKNDFKLEGWNLKEAISEVAENYTQNIIRNFVFDNFGFLHQHIYVFDLNTQIPANWSPDHRFLYSTAHNGTEKVYNLIFRIEHKLFNPAVGGEQELFFDCPVRINIKDQLFILKISTLERSVGRYFRHQVYGMGKDLDESDIITLVKDMLPPGSTAVPCDLNKGVKYLWDKDFVDAGYIKHRKAKSIATQSMDEDNLLKKIYPNEYLEIIKDPLDKSIFLVIDKTIDSSDYISRFLIEPTRGKITITRYADKNESVDNLLEKIIDNN